jgi:hypothetical protein
MTEQRTDEYVAKLMEVEYWARELITNGLRLKPDGLIITERKDRSDPHYRLCEALEAIQPGDHSKVGWMRHVQSRQSA